MAVQWLKSAARVFAARESGSVTVEFVIWTPVFLAMILATADISLAFMRQSNFLSVSRDTARIFARHGFNVEAAEDYARNRARIGDYEPEVTVALDPLTDLVTVTIEGRSDQVAPFGLLRRVLGETIGAKVTQTVEPI